VDPAALHHRRRRAYGAALCVLLAACAAPAASVEVSEPIAATASSSASEAPPSQSASSAPETAPESAETDRSPEEVVQAFYDWYLTDTDWNHLLVRPELTPAFVEELQNSELGYNPIVCAQDLPDSVHADSAIVEGSRAVVLTTVAFGGSAGQPGQTVDLELGPDGWLILAVNCED
jgi:hypothetical protein